MIIDHKKKHASVIVKKNENVEDGQSYKYLGTVIDDKMNFEDYVSNIYKKCNTRLFFLRKLGSFQVDVKIMELFYLSVIQSILEFCIICWFGSTTVASKLKFSKIVM